MRGWNNWLLRVAALVADGVLLGDLHLAQTLSNAMVMMVVVILFATMSRVGLIRGQRVTIVIVIVIVRTFVAILSRRRQRMSTTATVAPAVSRRRTASGGGASG